MIDCLGSPRSLHRGESASRWAPMAGGLEPPVAHSGSSHSATPARGWHPTRPGMGGGRGGEGRGGAEPCRAAPKELSVQWEDREVGSTVSWGPRRGSLPEQRPLRQKGLGSEGPAEGRAGAQKGLGAPLKGTSFLSGLQSHTIIHTLAAQ